MTIESSRFTTPETLAWAEAATRGVLLIKRCLSCSQVHYYPRPFCPFCFSDRTEYVESSGQGEIYSFSITRAAKEPYVIAYVTLDEGPTLMTNIVETEFKLIRIGQRVRVKFSGDLLGFPAPTFRVEISAPGPA